GGDGEGRSAGGRAKLGIRNGAGFAAPGSVLGGLVDCAAGGGGGGAGWAGSWASSASHLCKRLGSSLFFLFNLRLRSSSCSFIVPSSSKCSKIWSFCARTSDDVAAKRTPVMRIA